MVTEERLRHALAIVQQATEEFVARGYFLPGVLARLVQWMSSLPHDCKELAKQIALLAGRQDAGTGADVNGIALDREGKPSLESLVIYYDLQERGLFPEEAVASVREKLTSHRGPLYSGPWP